MGSRAAERGLREPDGHQGRARRPWLLLLVLVPLGSVVLLSEVPLCPLAGWLGLPCPGCGLTRATVALLQGDVGGALRLHPLVFVAAPAFLLLLGSLLLRALGIEPLWTERLAGVVTSRWTTLAASALAVTLIVVWALRFAGYFGGPAPVTTYAEWWRSQNLRR